MASRMIDTLTLLGGELRDLALQFIVRDPDKAGHYTARAEAVEQATQELTLRSALLASCKEIQLLLEGDQ